MVVVMLPFPESILEFVQIIVVVYSKQLLLDDADHAFEVRIALRVAVVCGDLPKPKGLLVLHVCLQGWLAFVVANDGQN